MGAKQETNDGRLVTQVFVDGAKKGWNVGVFNMLPNVVMAFVIIHALNIVGLLDLLGNVLGPVMAIFGIPGEGAAVLAGAWLSMGGGIGVAASLFEQGVLDGQHLVILFPAIFLMGSQIQYAGRLLGTAQVNANHWPVLFGICILNGLIAMLVMNYLALPLF
ncbi:YjiG family protein [Natranaerobius thermophilus]|uniref:Nucleoside recognition domain protein n=1 Tax=Natranaerobius thermophilus (strain ATCC BAA-1301 / DSM 18059 / JW/NM-WN-LF) TaxID=457570 RepID=B2A7R4_NATTJ|nr:YjiG family protein [Natranaerobius thermophilus]ACB84366.1 nucleoside recognition domain protein [Natranaerobius thermophilus JW/NM-WN-LF]